MPAPWARGIRARIVGQIHGQETNNVLHFATNLQGFDDPLFERDQLFQLATFILECVVETLLPAVSQDWRILRVECSSVFPEKSDPMIANATDPVLGELSNASHSFAATLVHIRSGVGGKRGRGRMFLPPVGEGQTTNSAIDPGTIALITAFLACMAGKFIGAGASTQYRIGVLSRTLAGPTNAQFNDGFFEALALEPASRVAIMSSRKVGSGS